MCFVLVTFHKLASFSKKQELKMFIYVVIFNTNNIFIQFLQWNWHIFVYLVITMLKFKILSILLIHSLVQFHHFNHINDNFMPQKKTLFSYCTKDKTFIFSNFYCFLFLIQKIWRNYMMMLWYNWEKNMKRKSIFFS
jgi:hypothetical protein